jgi:hypothetical protein
MKRSFTVMLGASDGVEAFLGVARHHSFRKAAGELGVTKSAVSQAIRAWRRALAWRYSSEPREASASEPSAQ